MDLANVGDNLFMGKRWKRWWWASYNVPNYRKTDEMNGEEENTLHHMSTRRS